MEVEAQISVRLRPLSLQRIEEDARPAYIHHGFESLGIDSGNRHVVEDPAVASALSDVLAERGPQNRHVEFSFNGK